MCGRISSRAGLPPLITLGFVVLKVRRLVGRRKRKELNQTVGRGFAMSIGGTSGRVNSLLEES